MQDFRHGARPSSASPNALLFKPVPVAAPRSRPVCGRARARCPGRTSTRSASRPPMADVAAPYAWALWWCCETR